MIRPGLHYFDKHFEALALVCIRASGTCTDISGILRVKVKCARTFHTDASDQIARQNTLTSLLTLITDSGYR